MSEISLLENLNKISSQLSEEDLQTLVVPKVTLELSSYIEKLARKTIPSKEFNQLAFDSFKEHAKLKIATALHAFIFKSKLWEQNRNPVPYIKVCLKRMASDLEYEDKDIKKTVKLACPLCKEFKIKSYLVQQDKLWSCLKCTDNAQKYQEALEHAISHKNIALIGSLQAKLRSCSIFSVHSRKGFSCPDCQRFIPQSASNEYGISCPYDNCLFSGEIKNLQIMNHPVEAGREFKRSKDISLDAPINEDNKNRSVLDNINHFHKNDSQILPDDMLLMKQQSEKELGLLLEVIDDQMQLTKRHSTTATQHQKTLMYQAYKNMTHKYPQDMVSYLVHRKQLSDFPIQSKIFQEYVSLMENALPFVLKKGSKSTPILSLTSPELNLFLGQSTFETVIKNNFSIGNETKENYIGERNHKHYGPCFIGKLIEITDIDTGMSLLSHVKDYSFVQINLNSDVRVGARVRVNHFRIPCHYETMHLVFLQRARRQIVDRIYFKINKKKRNTKV